jgi:hypothetical protein
VTIRISSLIEEGAPQKVSTKRSGKFPMGPIVRVSVIRCAPDRFAEIRQMLMGDEKVLRPGIEAMRGLLAFYTGADEATSSFTQVSLWVDLAAAKQLDRFQPMLDLGKEYVARGATFERPIMNYATLWQLGPKAGVG